MSFSAENRSRPRLPLDGAMSQEPPLKRLRSLLGVDPSLAEVSHGLGTALGFSSDPLSLSVYGRAFPSASDAIWPLRTGLDENLLAASAVPMSLGSLGSFGMPSSAASFIERNLPKLEASQIAPLMDLGVVHAQPLAALAGIQVPGLTLIPHPRSKTKLCRHFIEGKCKFKEICNFAHSIEELKSMPDEGDLEGKSLVEKYKAKADAEKQAAGSGHQDAIPAGELKTKLCKHYIEGECKFKDGCHFAHSIEELKKLPDEGDDAGKVLLERYKVKVKTVTTTGGDQAQGVEPSGSSSTGSADLKAKLCKHFIVGNCKFKETCPFAHSIEELKKLPGDEDGNGKALVEQYQLKLNAEKPLSGHDSIQVNETANVDRVKLENTTLDAQHIQKLGMDSTGIVSADAKVDDKSIRLMKTRLCKHFLVGACKYMDRCTFAHSIEELKPPADAEDLVTKATPISSSASPSKKNEITIASANLQATPPAQSTQQSDGKHTEVSAKGSETKDDKQELQKTKHTEVSAKGAETKDDKQELQKTKACRYFLDGTCRFGDVCAFLHDNEQIHGNGSALQSGVPQGPAEVKPTYKTRLCNMWEKDKTCTFGSKCHFAHGPEELRSRAGPSIPGSSSLLYGALGLENLSRARQLGLAMPLPYSYEVTDTKWQPFQIADEGRNGLGGLGAGLLQNYGQLGQASSLASLSSLGGLGGVNLGLASGIFGNLPAWQTR